MPHSDPTTHSRSATRDTDDSLSGIQLVSDALDRLRYGAIQLTVHDGRLVQVDVTERTRFTDRG